MSLKKQEVLARARVGNELLEPLAPLVLKYIYKKGKKGKKLKVYARVRAREAQNS